MVSKAGVSTMSDRGRKVSPYAERTCMTIGGADPSFVDTNLLIHAKITSAPLHEQARRVLEELFNAGVEVWISRQVIREYLAALSRPQTFTRPLPAVELRRDVEELSERFRIVDEDERVTDQLLDLLGQFPTGGKQVHDTNIVATMLVNRIPRLVTHNVADFARFTPVIDVVPLV